MKEKERWKPTDEEGAQLIIWLQAFAGIKEPHHSALAGWKAMTEAQQIQTWATFMVLNEAENEQNNLN